jgi:acetyl esterase/lipase
MFRDECLDYGARLAQAGIPTELHSWAGGFRASEFAVPHAEISRAALAARTSYLRRAVRQFTA